MKILIAAAAFAITGAVTVQAADIFNCGALGYAMHDGKVSVFARLPYPDPDTSTPDCGLQARLRATLAEYRLCRCPDAGEYRGDCPDGRKLDDGRVLCRTPADPYAQ